MFRTDLLSIIRSLDTLFTAIGICHTEILKWVKITNIYIYIYTHTHTHTHTLSLNCKTYVVSKILFYVKVLIQYQD